MVLLILDINTSVSLVFVVKSGLYYMYQLTKCVPNPYIRGQKAHLRR